MLTVLLTRHGHTDRSEPDQYTGQTIEAHLTERGRAGASALGERLAPVTIDRVISSPLERAIETARLVRPNDEIETDDRLMEADYGDWEGTPVDEVDDRWPELRVAWEAEPDVVPYPNGETGRQVADRVGSLLDGLVDWEMGLGTEETEHRVLLVGHATTNRVLLAVALEVPLHDFRRRFQQDWVNLTVLRYSARPEAGPMLLLANDLSHLYGVKGATWDL